MRATAYLVSTLLLLLVEAVGAQTVEDQIQSSFHSGQQAMQQGQFEQAADEFKKVLKLDPTLVEAEVNLGLAYQSLLQYDLALNYLTKALHEKPMLIGPTMIVGLDYLKLGSPKKGIPYLQQALKLDSSNTNAREALASSYLSEEDFRNAAEQFKQIAALNSDKSEAWFKLGHEYLDLAARLAYRGAHLYRESTWGHRFLGDLLFQRSRWDDAAKEYQKALAAGPAEPGLHTSLGQAYLHAQEREEAEKEFRSDLKADSRIQLAWLGLSSAQLAGGKPESALESVRKAWEISPEFLELQRDFPYIEIPEEAAKISIADLQNRPDEPAKQFLLAALCIAVNDNACAGTGWNEFQDKVATWRQTALSNGAQKVGDPCLTRQYSRCIASLQAKKTLTGAERLLLGKMQLSMQRYEPAADSLAQVQGVTKENAEASYWLARTYQALGTESYARLQDTLPDSWRACQMRAEGAALRGNLDEALKEFHAALQLHPNDAELHEAFGEFYLTQDADEAAAQSELEAALALDPARTHALYLLGYLFVQKKDNVKAVPYLQRALLLQPDLTEASSLLGTAYVRLGQFSESIAPLQKALPSDHYGNVHYQLYIAYRKLGKPDVAKKELALSQELRRSYLAHDEALILGSPQPVAEPQ